jgi:hypothetical protein
VDEKEPERLVPPIPYEEKILLELVKEYYEQMSVHKGGGELRGADREEAEFTFEF